MKKISGYVVLTVPSLIIALLLITISADARIVSVQMSAATIAFGGFSWPGVGQYEKITGVAYAEVDPNDRRNSVIVDITRAQTQAAPGQPGKTPSGKVAYLLNFYILKPVNLNQVDRSLNGYGKMMYEPPNRGGKTWTALGRVTGGGNDPATITDPTILANSFLMPRGYTLVWSGWEPLGVPLACLGSTLTQAVALPVVKNSDGSTVTGPAYEYIVSPGAAAQLSYAAADTMDKTTAVLTHRVHLDDPPQMVSSSSWDYTTVTQTIPGCSPSPQQPGIQLLPAGTNFVANDIYEFSYTAKDPTVAGLGFAAVRDWVSWLRYEAQDDNGARNPLANYITRVYTEISSQPGRMFNDFRKLGFNEDDRGKIGTTGRKVFDGHMQWIAAGSGIGMNYRFSQSGRTERNRQDHLYGENLFPFANVSTTDPFTGITASRYDACQQSNTCAFGVEIYSANEYWVKTASLLHTKPDGSADLPDSAFNRNYFVSSMQHGTGNATSRGACQQLGNPLNSAPVQRALFLALDAWVNNGILPPASRVPRLDDGTLVLPANTGFPTNIPDTGGLAPSGKVTYTGLKTSRYLFNFGPGFYDASNPATFGIPIFFPPARPDNTPLQPPLEPLLTDSPVPVMSANGPVYPSLVPKTDRDGNDIAGVRLPDVTVPLATYTGWGLRSGPQANDGCESTGQYIPFPKTKDDRTSSGDPRRSIEERYPTFDEYFNRIEHAVNNLIKDRLMLCEDGDDQIDRLVQAGLDAGVPPPNGDVPQAELRSCKPPTAKGAKN